METEDVDFALREMAGEPDREGVPLEAENEFQRSVAEAFGGLPYRERRVLEMSLGVDGPPRSAAEIAEGLRLGTEEIEELRQSALERISGVVGEEAVEGMAWEDMPISDALRQRLDEVSLGSAAEAARYTAEELRRVLHDGMSVEEVKFHLAQHDRTLADGATYRHDTFTPLTDRLGEGRMETQVANALMREGIYTVEQAREYEYRLALIPMIGEGSLALIEERILRDD